MMKVVCSLVFIIFPVHGAFLSSPPSLYVTATSMSLPTSRYSNCPPTAALGRNHSYEGTLQQQFCYKSEIAQMDPTGQIPSMLPRPLSLLKRPSLSRAWGMGEGGGSHGMGGDIVEVVSGRSVEIRLSEDFTPLERIAISADGNLQRIISSYYNSPVSVVIKRCHELQPGIYDRQVDLMVFDQVFCTATSRIVPQTPECADLLAGKSIALSQLFRALGAHPTFRLLDCGKKSPSKDFWRLYELTSPQVTCQILEEFVAQTFHLKPLSPSSSSPPVAHRERDLDVETRPPPTWL